MSQAAQQDHLVVESTATLATLDATAKAKLVECCKLGTIDDVILVTAETYNIKNKTKILAHTKDVSTPSNPKYKILVYNTYSGQVVSVELN